MGKGRFERQSTHQRDRRGRAMRGVVKPQRAGQGRVELPCLQYETGGQDTGPGPERSTQRMAMQTWREAPVEKSLSERHKKHTSTPSSAPSLRPAQKAENHLPAPSRRHAVASMSGSPV